LITTPGRAGAFDHGKDVRGLDCHRHARQLAGEASRRDPAAFDADQRVLLDLPRPDEGARRWPPIRRSLWRRRGVGLRGNGPDRAQQARREQQPSGSPGNSRAAIAGACYRLTWRTGRHIGHSCAAGFTKTLARVDRHSTICATHDSIMRPFGCRAAARRQSQRMILAVQPQPSGCSGPGSPFLELFKISKRKAAAGTI
jgi:hypothetical protein